MTHIEVFKKEVALDTAKQLFGYLLFKTVTYTAKKLKNKAILS